MSPRISRTKMPVQAKERERQTMSLVRPGFAVRTTPRYAPKYMRRSP